MALMTYVLKDRHGTYYFRRGIPLALRPFMPEPWTGKHEWKRSLKTKLPAEAKRNASRALSDCTAVFLAAERSSRGELSQPNHPVRLDAGTLAELEADAVRLLLEADAAERSIGDDRRHLLTPKDREAMPLLVPVAFGQKGMAEDHWHALGDMLEEDAVVYRKALSRFDPSCVLRERDAGLRRLGVIDGLTPDELHEAGLAVLRGHVRAYKLLLDRQKGEVVETPKPSKERGPKLSDAFDSWKAGGTAQGAKKPGDNTVLEAEHVVRRFKEWHGDLRLAEITREKAREFRDALARMPTRLKRDLLKLPLPKLLKHPDAIGPMPHASTVNKALQLLGAITAHSVREGHMDKAGGFANPFDKGIKLIIDQRETEGRDIFEPADLRALFGTSIYGPENKRPRGGTGEAAYWLPLLGLMTGARLGELAQLRIEDLRQDPETSIWFFNISTEGGRSLKTASSRRRVPMHPVLETIGLLRYRQSLLGAGAPASSPLWPDLVVPAWSKWFNRWLGDTAGVTAQGKVFHSFRHTFKRLARDAGITEELHDALTGHSGGGVGRDYGGGFGLKRLSEAMALIEAMPEVEKLRWTQGEATTSRRPRLPKVKLSPRKPRLDG